MQLVLACSVLSRTGADFSIALFGLVYIYYAIRGLSHEEPFTLEYKLQLVGGLALQGLLFSCALPFNISVEGVGFLFYAALITKF